MNSSMRTACGNELSTLLDGNKGQNQGWKFHYEVTESCRLWGGRAHLLHIQFPLVFLQLPHRTELPAALICVSKRFVTGTYNAGATSYPRHSPTASSCPYRMSRERTQNQRVVVPSSSQLGLSSVCTHEMKALWKGYSFGPQGGIPAHGDALCAIQRPHPHHLPHIPTQLL